jgi:hypothetical protein
MASAELAMMGTHRAVATHDRAKRVGSGGRLGARLGAASGGSSRVDGLCPAFHVRLSLLVVAAAAAVTGGLAEALHEGGVAR